MKSSANSDKPSFSWWTNSLLLTGVKATIRSATRDDATHLFKWWNDPSVMSHVGFPHGLGIGLEEIEKMFTPEGTNQNRLIVLDRVTQMPIGEMSFQILGAGEATLGLKIGELSFRGLGYGRESLELLVRYLSERGDVTRISLEVLEANKRACNLYETSGFKFLGLRSAPHSEHTTGRLLPVRRYGLSI